MELRLPLEVFPGRQATCRAVFGTWAYEIQKGMMKQFPSSSDRGVKPSRFYVLRHASCPSLLMEVGFLSNNREGKSLATAATQDKIVKAIIDGMIGYTTALRRTKAAR